ncbi:MAG: glycoside hydrolase family 3 C-terminal domain-containing protein [Oscillospiraceae bacterium]|nr:glycoside hydrolase family 3 C-terminal domain-containing protein [Oscillospiraceae bacterium]
MKNGTNGRAKQLLWRGLTTLTAGLTVLALTGSVIVNGFRTDIDKFLGTSSTRIVSEEADPSTAYGYKSDYATTAELVQAIADVGERMNEEGSVLLKNNGALPLSASEKSKVSLLGFSSYHPVMGGIMGSSLTENVGTDADTVDFVAALKAKGYTYNPTLETIYETLRPTYETEVASWFGSSFYPNITAPANSAGSFFTSKEPSPAALDGADGSWRGTLNDYNVMIVTIARAGSENANYTPGEAGVDPSQSLNQTDPLGLSDDERALIQAAIDAKSANGGKVIVLLNNASALEIQELKDNDGIDAMLQIGLPGGYGFYGVCDVLDGTVNPSGRLPDTYAVKASLSPAAQNYGFLMWANAQPEININSAIVEAEGIYTGYKYYETRFIDAELGQGNATSSVGSTSGAWNYDNEVTYPFGYGLSYTTFEQTLDSVTVDLGAQTATAVVTVKNTGSVAGKDVVQLYVSTPYTDYDKTHGVEKAGVQLLDFDKTEVIEPGGSFTTTITADLQYMASWDSTADNLLGTKGNYILDAGTYYFAIGNAHEAAQAVVDAMKGNASAVKTWELGALDDTTFARSKNGTAVENQLDNLDLNYWMPGTVTYLSRSDWEGTFPKTYENLTATAEMVTVMQNDNYEIQHTGSSVVFGQNNNLKLADLKGVTDLDDERWALLMDQIKLEDCMIRTGFGGTSTKAIESIMSPEAVQNDGPNGIYSYPLAQYANTDKTSGDPCAIDANDKNANYRAGVMGNETVIASTFNKALAREYGKVMGNYSLWSNLPIWWGIGVNLHRVPYNARNHEYYSEDSVLTSFMGAATIEGAQYYGVIAAPKHIAFNDSEANRTGVATFMTEQKAREGELRATQSCFEDAQCLGAMTAYNRDGVYTDNAHPTLLKNIVRGEWGFKGLMSEDFIMDPTYVTLKEAVINGVTMSCNTGDSTMEAVSAKYQGWTVENVKDDPELTAALKQVMTWQAYALANSNAMDGYSSSTRLEKVTTWYDIALTVTWICFAVLTVGSAFMYVKSRKEEN